MYKKQASEFTMEDFLSGKKFDYIVYSDRPDFGLYYSNGSLKKGSKIIAEVLPFHEGTFQVNIWVLGPITVRYLRLEHCYHSKPVGHLIKSIKNHLKFSTNS